MKRVFNYVSQCTRESQPSLESLDIEPQIFHEPILGPTRPTHPPTTSVDETSPNPQPKDMFCAESGIHDLEPSSRIRTNDFKFEIQSNNFLSRSTLISVNGNMFMMIIRIVKFSNNNVLHIFFGYKIYLFILLQKKKHER